MNLLSKNPHHPKIISLDFLENILKNINQSLLNENFRLFLHAKETLEKLYL